MNTQDVLSILQRSQFEAIGVFFDLLNVCLRKRL